MKKERYIIIVSILLLLGIAFYWFGLRPSFAKKACYKEANNARTEAIYSDNSIVERGINITRGDYDKILQEYYDKCLMRKGLKQTHEKPN